MLLFVASDPHHGLGLKKFLQEESGWMIVYPYPSTSVSPFVEKGFLPIAIPEEEALICTTQYLLQHPQVQDFIQKNLRVTLVVFKNSYEIQTLAQSFPNVTLVASPPLLAQRVENKFHVIPLLEGLPTLPSLLLTPSEFPQGFDQWGEPLVCQYPRGNAGKGTFLVFRETETAFLGTRPLKVTPYLPGETYTLNGCVSETDIWISFPFKQLTGMAGLTPHALGSCGNDFDPEEDMTWKEFSPELQHLAFHIGKRLQKLEFRGFFGIDFLIPFKNRTPHIIEINPRLTGNVAFSGLLGCELILKHLSAFEWEPLFPETIRARSIEITGGAQLIFRTLGSEQIQPACPSGIYQLKDDRFQFVRAGWDIQHLEENEYLLLFRRREEHFRILKNRPLRQWASVSKIVQASQEFMALPIPSAISSPVAV